jgi:Fe-S-cluster containining protein
MMDNLEINKLSEQDSRVLDTLFVNETQEVFKNTDCLTCANCCKNYSPIIEPEEIPMLCKAIGIESSQFFQDYVEMDEDGDFVFKSQPCPLLNLDDNKCSIYENRPQACREYPHTNMKEMKNHLDLLEKNIEICPAAEEIVRRVLNKIEHV